MKEMPTFDPEKCNNCRLCLSVCEHGGFFLHGHIMEMNDQADCDFCKNCEIVCPTGAITFSFEVVDES